MRNTKAKIFIFGVFKDYKHLHDYWKFHCDCITYKEVIYKLYLLGIQSRKVCNEKFVYK